MKGEAKVSKKEVEAAIRSCSGRLTEVAKLLGWPYWKARSWMASHADHQALAEQLREELLDKAESEIAALLDSRDPEVRRDAAKFVLKELGRSRGWGSPKPVAETSVKIGETEIRSIFGA